MVLVVCCREDKGLRIVFGVRGNVLYMEIRVFFSKVLIVFFFLKF